MQKTLYIPIDTTLDNTVECEKLIKRGDTLLLQLKIFTNGALADLSGQKVDLILKKSDGNLIQKVITSISNGTVTALLDLQATNVPGQVLGESQLTDSNGQTSTNTFIFTVDESIANDVLVYSKPSIEVLNDLRAMITDTENMITKYSSDVGAISNSIEAIEALENIKSYIDTNLPLLQSNNAQAITNYRRLENDITNGTELAVRLEKDIVDGNVLNIDLKQDISTGNTTHNSLQLDIKDCNYIIEQLKGSNWNYVLSMCQLYEKTLVGQVLTDENDVALTDENDTSLTF
ncbi:hypothetical protein CLSAB_19460 [Clostridium saccharobutylicum]|uniref:BppU family phage baseplate upper protein n=1 Tax=Clostridium saccharobutylicum TaxID=169679 RepID=UPI00098C3C85|nr:BppU family phage baseplate upper protein [Clostridium saccharobutylicum]OOM17226.1 hypothetical protein CLSAB_19460 [Clostridium saccharobutylicum]